MTPKELYPIGTQLITRRLSQAALAYELGFWVETQDSTGEWCNSFHVDANVIEIVGEDTDVCVAEFASTWRVTVTKENQKWLSPVPMVGDLFEFKDQDSWLKSKNGDKHVIYRYIIDSPSMVEFLMREERLPTYLPNIETIVERKYPNNQRAPMLEWDEVILPTKGEQS